MLKKKDIRHIYDSYSQLRKMKRVNELRPDSKPKALNLNIIDSCNSKCTICNIWKNEESVDITPEELERRMEHITPVLGSGGYGARVPGPDPSQVCAGVKTGG